MANKDKEDLRKYERVPFVEDILIDGMMSCTSTDISEGGLYVSAIQHFKENAVLDVTIPFKKEKITFKGQVRYCQGGIGVGIKFINLNDEQKAIIKWIIESIVKKSA
jgi:hypothetical protein